MRGPLFEPYVGGLLRKAAIRLAFLLLCLGRAKNRRVEFRLIRSEVETPPKEVLPPMAPPAAPGGTAPGSERPKSRVVPAS